MKKVFKWLDNYWYHYKWTTIIALFVISLVVVGIVQMAQKEEYDACFIYLGEGSGSITGTQYEDIVSTLGKHTEDYSGDGEVNVSFSRIAYIADSNDLYYGSESEVSSFMSSSCFSYYIYFISESVYKIYKDEGLFVKLSDFLAEKPEYAYDDYAVRLKDTKAGSEEAGISELPDDTLVVLKTVPYYSSKSKTENETTLRDNHAEIFRKLLSY